MIQFDIINPHDPYTMTAETHQVAAVAVCLLGEGKYGLNGLAPYEGMEVPVFLLGGHDRWFTSAFGTSFEQTANECLTNQREAVAAALESIECRAARTSMVDLAALGKALAESVRSIKRVEPEAA